MSHKVVINARHGGFSLSREARDWLADHGYVPAQVERERNPACGYSYRPDMERHDPLLVACVEALGAKSNGMCADLTIETVERMYRINEYDGYESIEEPNTVDWIDPEKRAAQ